ncbi:MAG: aspartate aminotransferase family protein, partial [Deltaproteobacteria bacterium CG_4_10_14_0_2_um_filter_43_8]
MNFLHSKQHFEAAQHFFPGGVNSPVRAFGAVGGVPPFIVKAKGAHLWDADGNHYIDYVGSWGPAILGHADSDVQAAIINALENGTSFGAPTLQETELAQIICKLLPSIEMLRFVNSGTEACMSAIRLARGYTKRNKIIKCEGCYHGHADSLLVKAGSGAASHGEPTSAGVPATLATDTIVLPYNNLNAFAEVMMQHGSEVAAIIIEPVAGNMGCVPPGLDFLECLRKLCTQ